MRTNNVRAAGRTVLHGLIVAILSVVLALPELYQALGLHPAEAGGLIGGVLAVSVVVARVMAVPAVDAWLRRFGLGIDQIHPPRNGAGGEVENTGEGGGGPASR
jgi:hypothetical protein